MGIKIVIVVALFCSLIYSVSSAAFYATHAEKLNTSKCGHHHKHTGKFVASVNPQFFSMRGFSCGSVLKVMCGEHGGDRPYCKHGKFIEVKIVGECSPADCHGNDDMVLSKEAFETIAKIEEKKIEVTWIPAPL